MKTRIAIFGSLLLAFLAVTGMTLPISEGPGCDCSAHGRTQVPAPR
ncbi:MAG TPA: hypothetical protein VFX30_02900 [bacterium]|nr:hypothetical protein [bacterium]